MRAVLSRSVEILVAVLAIVELVRLILDPQPLDVPVVGLLALIGIALVARSGSAAGESPERTSEAASFARILHGLARSSSPDAIFEAIVEELGYGTGATHVAVVRRRPEAGRLDVTLIAARPGTPQSRTTLPISELDDPGGIPARSRQMVTGAAGRRVTAVPIEPDPGGDPQLAPLGLAAERFEARPGALSRAAIRSGQRVADRLAGRLREVYGLRNVIASPLRVNGRLEGAIVLARLADEPWPASARRILDAAAIETSGALGRVDALRAAEARATTDALTGLPNRRYFDEYVALLARRRRAEDRIGVLMIDLDLFKQLNDSYGHAAGDRVLQEVARAIAATVRDQDVPARYGGEEFVVLLKNPSQEVAVEVGERVRRAIGAIDLQELGVPSVSVSIGVAVAETPDRRLDVVIREADEALYRAKRAGRDRVVAG